MSNNFLSTCTGTACFDNNPAVGALSPGSDSGIFSISVQVIFCQKHSFLHQLTQNMTTDCLLNYKFSKDIMEVTFELGHDAVQVIFCQKHSFLSQFTQNMITDCPLNYKFSTMSK